MSSSFGFRLAEKEEQCDIAAQQLYHRDETIASMKGEKAKLDRDGSSRVANLNQALMQEKQACSRLSEENEVLKRNEHELLAKYETLQHKFDEVVARGDRPCKSCLEKSQHQRLLTPVKTPSRPWSTPGRPFPQETELDALQIENAKLKQELECLHTNFQLASQKSAQFKKETKEMELSTAELQAAYDQILAEKEELELKQEEAKVALANSTSSQVNDRKRNVRLGKEVQDLQANLETLQHQNLELQEKLKTEIAQSLDSQGVIEKLNAQIKHLKEDKGRVETDLSGALKRLQHIQDELVSSQHSNELQSEIKRQSSEAITAHKRKVAHLKDENEDLRDQLEKAGHLIDEQQSQIHSLKESIKLLQSKVAGAEARNELLTTQREQQSCLPTEIEDLQKKLANLSEEHEALLATKKELQEAQTQSETHIKEMAKANSKLSREASHNWELAKKLQKELERQESCSLTTKEGLQKKEQLCSKMIVEVEDLKLELSSATNAKTMYEVEVSKLMSKLEELEQCNFELSTKLSDAQDEANTASHFQSETQSKLEELERKLGAAESSLLEKDPLIAELQCTNELLQEESGTLLSQVTSLSEMVASRNAKIEALHSQIADHESDSREIMIKICELESDHDRYIQTQQALQEEIDWLKEALESANSSKKEMENTILSLKLEVKQLQEYNCSLETVNCGLQEKIKGEMAKNEELDSTCQNMGRNLYDLERELKLKSASLKAALNDIDFIKSSSEDATTSLKTEVNALEVKCRELQDACDDLQQLKTEMTAQLSTQRTEVRELQHLNSMITSEKESLVECYEQCQMKLGSLQEELHAVQRELKETKTSLWYQKEKLSEAQCENGSIKQELVHAVDEYEKLKESALSLLECSYHSDENASTPTRLKLKGILKKPGPKGLGVLKSVENLVD